MESKRKIQSINETKSWFFENTTKDDKSLAKLNKRKRKKAHDDRIGDEGLYFTRIKVIQIIREYFENLYSKRLKKSRGNAYISRCT
jgi:hypothetical protein